MPIICWHYIDFQKKSLPSLCELTCCIGQASCQLLQPRHSSALVYAATKHCRRHFRSLTCHIGASFVQGGGVLLSVHDRPFGRGRRGQRMTSFPLLWVDTSGRLHANLVLHAATSHGWRGPMVADGAWHRVTVCMAPLQPSW